MAVDGPDITHLDTTQLPDGAGRADSRLDWYRCGDKRFFTLSQRGRAEDIAYDHGRLLSHQIENGVFPEIIDTIDVDTDLSKDWMDRALDAVFLKITDDVFKSSSAEAQQSIDALFDGYAAGAGNARFSRRDVVMASLAIDVGNIASGLARRQRKPRAPENAQLKLYLVGAVLGRSGLWGRLFGRRRLLRSTDDLGARLDKDVRRRLRVGMGCTGFAAAPALTADGVGLHARTFDGAFFAWNAFPGLFLIDETPANPSYQRYAAAGCAGLPYPGGIGGVNEAGISASLHQMSTTTYSTGQRDGRSDIAPIVQQRVLREAASLDDAVDIVRSAQHFASWTIFLSDAKTGKAARVELNGREDEPRNRYDGRVEAMDLGPWAAQSNHFLSRLAERNDFFGDAHFTPTLGKWLETRARHNTVTEKMSAMTADQSLDTDAAIDLLADHKDAMLDGAARSFGRTICKSYGQTAVITRTDPDRDRRADQLWVTIGDQTPGPHATHVGFRLDWSEGVLTPVAERPARRAASVDAGFGAALSAYCAAFQTLWRPRDAAGGYLGGKPSPADEARLTDSALDKLGAAIAALEAEGRLDPPLRYIRARLLQDAGRHDAAEADWAVLRALIDAPRADAPILDYEAALILILSAWSAAMRGDAAHSAAWLDQGENQLEATARRIFGDAPVHEGIKDWRKAIAALRDDPASAAPPPMDWVTVE